MIVKFFIFAVVVYFLYRMFVNDKKKKEDKATKEAEKQVASGIMVKDPICGAYVDPENSVSVRNGEKVEHFCSYECREKYIAQIEGPKE